MMETNDISIVCKRTLKIEHETKKNIQVVEHTRIVQPPATAHPILCESQCKLDESQKLL